MTRNGGKSVRAVLGGLLALCSAVQASAQPPGGGPPGAAQRPATPKAAAPIDLTGWWVSVVTEDWRWRMVTPLRGDFANIPATPAAHALGAAWDPAKDEAAGERCKAYGAPAILRRPGRLHITWTDDATLKIESDAGQQTRLLHFAAPGSPALTSTSQQRSLQGYSIAEWQRSGGALDAFGPGLAPEGGGRGAAPQRWGSLKVSTSNMLPGWLSRNGVPYSQNMTMTEYYTRITNKDAGDWFVVTTVLEDSQYLTGQWITSTNFKKEPSDAKWAPALCKS